VSLALPGWRVLLYKTAMLRYVLVLSVVLAGCSAPVEMESSYVRPKTSRVDWFGHQSFFITTSLGNKILTNPFFPGTASRPMPNGLTPDVVLITNESRESNNTDVYDNSPVIFRGSVGMGTNNAGGTRIRGIPVFPDPSSPDAVKMNLVFSWVSDGMKFCFPGDPASPLTSSDIAQIGSVDVLFLPVGGRMGAAGRNALIAQLRPRVIIPMGRASEISSWAAGFGKVHRIEGRSVLLNREALPQEPVALLFAP
jgi:L-ascorbate metabolism protein UlaG (beta-lactamase superfamily)